MWYKEPREAVAGCQGIYLVIVGSRFDAWLGLSAISVVSLGKKLYFYCLSHPAVKPGTYCLCLGVSKLASLVPRLLFCVEAEKSGLGTRLYQGMAFWTFCVTFYLFIYLFIITEQTAGWLRKKEKSQIHSYNDYTCIHNLRFTGFH